MSNKIVVFENKAFQNCITSSRKSLNSSFFIDAPHIQ